MRPLRRGVRRPTEERDDAEIDPFQLWIRALLGIVVGVGFGAAAWNYFPDAVPWFRVVATVLAALAGVVVGAVMHWLSPLT